MKQGRVDILDIVDIPRYLGDGGVVVGVDEVDVVWSPADHEDGHYQREHLYYLDSVDKASVPIHIIFYLMFFTTFSLFFLIKVEADLEMIIFVCLSFSYLQ